jgi:hypothetical protein
MLAEYVSDYLPGVSGVNDSHEEGIETRNRESKE